MGDYVSQAELKSRFADDEEVGFLTDDEGGTIDTAVLDDVIESAEGLVNSGIAMRYATPVSSSEASTTALVKRMTLDAAEVMLIQRGSSVSDAKAAQLERVEAWVQLIAEGKRVLPGASTAASTGSRDPLAKWSDAGRTLSTTSSRLFAREKTGRS